MHKECELQLYVLVAHVAGFNKTTGYTASLAQLRTCRKFDVECFLGFPSGHSSMAFAGTFGTGLMYFMVPWLLDGLINALCCCDNATFLRTPPHVTPPSSLYCSPSERGNHGPPWFIARIADQNQYNKLLGNVRITFREFGSDRISTVNYLK